MSDDCITGDGHKINDLENERYRIVESMSRLPHKILKHHNLQFLSQILLHELGHDNCFGLKKAVYLIDNPDFDHLVGVAGFDKCECKYHKDDLWHAPDSFIDDMEHAQFHSNVIKIVKQSLSRKKVDLGKTDDFIKLGKIIGLEDPQFFSWDMKYGNHGILIFEQDRCLCPWSRHLLTNAAALLSLCGI